MIASFHSTMDLVGPYDLTKKLQIDVAHP